LRFLLVLLLLLSGVVVGVVDVGLGAGPAEALLRYGLADGIWVGTSVVRWPELDWGGGVWWSASRVVSGRRGGEWSGTCSGKWSGVKWASGVG
jgi:hypothetical protein